MPLTKQELIERCDSFIERYKNKENMKDVVTITVTMYISLASVFEDVSVEESIELMQSYLGKLKDISDKFENVKDEEKKKIKRKFSDERQKSYFGRRFNEVSQFFNKRIGRFCYRKSNTI